MVSFQAVEDIPPPPTTTDWTSVQTPYEKLMELGRNVIAAERVFGKNSPQHRRAVAAWNRQQQKVGAR